jgi:hypothetical protein
LFSHCSIPSLLKSSFRDTRKANGYSRLVSFPFPFVSDLPRNAEAEESCSGHGQFEKRKNVVMCFRKRKRDERENPSNSDANQPDMAR